MCNNGTNWKEKLELEIAQAAGNSAEDGEYVEANVAAVERALRGQGPDDGDQPPEAGVRMVVNIASAHVPDFCDVSYKNNYDLRKHIVGQNISSTTRELVDSALSVDSYKKTYFGAVALSGAGIRFYGDLCLVLKADAVPKDTVILDRNSYDLIRSPLKERIVNKCDTAGEREKQAKKLSGKWDPDLPAIAAIKVLQQRRCDKRRLTTGQIADSILEDEDYIEVLKQGSFCHGNLQEVRTSATEATMEQRVRRKIRVGPPPLIEELVWLRRRKQAERALDRCSLEVRVVTTGGRVKS